MNFLVSKAKKIYKLRPTKVHVSSVWFTFAGVVDVLDYDKYYPNEEFQKNWLRRYLQVNQNVSFFSKLVNLFEF